ncbi:hypothetical protein BS17DRAFT_731403 [Gyrodon lividus]|nr:hypothetical protein BS17DRAFT_731403 [Gyrodon lividus]
MTSYGSSTDPPSPSYGTATFSTFSHSQTPLSPSRYSYSSSEAPRASSDTDSATSDRHMRRVNISPTRSRHSYDSYSEENSLEETAEVEAALNGLDNELDSTEDMLTEWSRGSGPSSYTGTTPSYSTSLDTYSIYNREGNRLSTISERTENIPSRPVSYLRDGARPANPTPEGNRLSAHRLSTASPGHLHSRSVTDLTSDRPLGRRTGDLIAFFEDRATTPSDTSFGHSRTTSMPGYRAQSPFFPHGQSTPYMSSTIGYGNTTTSYNTSTGYGSRPSSPAKSKVGSSISSSSSSVSEALSSASLLSPPSRGPTTTTGKSGTQLSPSDFASTFSNTFTASRSATNTSNITPTVSPLRRPQTSPRSPLTSVRNIVAAWKERTPSLGKTQSSTESTVSLPIKTEGLFSLRRRASRAEYRARERASGSQTSSQNADNGNNHPTTPKSVNNSIIPPPFDMSELGAYARDSREPLRIGVLWYLNVHSGPPYRWQRCQVLLYPHVLLLSWIAPGGGRGVVTLDLLNCTEVRSVPSPTHPSAEEDVGTIAAQAQVAEGDSHPLMELLCPFQLLYTDGVERLAAESARERVRWVSAVWEALDRSVTLPSRSEAGSPTGSIRTIRSMTSTTASGSGSGSASTVFVPPLHTIPSLSDLHTFSDTSSTGSMSRAPSFPTYHARTTDDAAVSNQSYLYLGDPRVIAPSRSSSLRRTSSLTDLDEEFASAVSRARNAKPGLGFGLSLVGGTILGDGSPVTVSSGPRLGGEVRVTPPPSAKAKARPLSDVSDDNFFSAGSRTSSNEPRTTTNSFYSMTASSASSSEERPTTTDIITDETAFEFTSGGSNTQVVASTLSYRRTESNSYLGDSHDGSYSYSSYTPTSPSRSTLSRSSEVRRRRYTHSEETSDKENTTSGYTASQSRSTLSTWTRSRSTTPTPVLPAAALSALEIPDSSGSEGYDTAHSPSTASFKSLPTIPSESDYVPVEWCKTDVSTEFYTAERCASDVSTEYVTAGKCKTVTETDFYTAEKCRTETETEFVTAELCECERSEESETHYETASLCKTIPSEASTPRSLVVDLPVRSAPTPPPKTPSVVPSLESPESEVHLDITPESVPLPPSEFSPTASSVSRDLLWEHLEETEVTLSIVHSSDVSVALPSTLESTSGEESSGIPTVSSITESSEFPMSDIPVSESTTSSPSPLASTESTPSIHLSQWALETDISYDSSHLQPTPFTQSIQLQEGREASFETSFIRPSVSPLTSLGTLTLITEVTSTSAPPTPLPPPPVPQSVSSPSSGPTPMTLTSTASSSLSRTPSTVSSVSSLSSEISLADNYGVSLADVPAPSEISTVPSLLSSQSSMHYYPHPTMIALPPSPAPTQSPAPSISVSMSTPQSNQPSIHSDLETEPTHTHTERTETITHEIDRLLHHIHELDHFRGQETREILEDVRIIRDELLDLSEYVRTRLVATERVVVTERPGAPLVPRRDQSVGGISVISESRVVGPRPRPRLVPITLTPPPVRSPSISSTRSISSFLSSHHSDDLLSADEEEFEMPPPSPAWPSEPSSPSSDVTPSIISSSESSPGPSLSLTSSSSSPTPPPSSPTPSTESSGTARPVEGVTMTIIRDMLTQLREQTTGLWDGQVSTNHILDELRQSRPVPQDNEEIHERLRHIETLVETLIDRRRETIEEVGTHRRETREARDESVTESDDPLDELESLRSRWDSLLRDRGRIPIHMPAPRPAGPSLDEQLVELLGAPPTHLPADIQSPPALTPFVYQPAPRPSRSRSASPILRRESAPPLPPEERIWSPETPHERLQPRPTRRAPLLHPRAQRQAPTEPPVQHETPRVIPRPIPSPSGAPRPPQTTADVPPTQPERIPQVRPAYPILPQSLHDRPPSAPSMLGGVDEPRASASWYRRPRAGPGVVPPPGAIDDRVQQPGTRPQDPTYVPMPPGPTVVQLPLFDTLMAILREHRLAQLATVDQQRELMRYMNGLNEWLARDVHDRQAELRGVTARIDQLRADLGRLGIGAAPGIPMPEPQPGQPAHGAGGFVIPPLPPGAIAGPVHQPPIVGGPFPGFVPQAPPQPPVIPTFERGSSVHTPVIPQPPPGWGFPMPEPSHYTGPVIPPGAPFEEYPSQSVPSAYFHPNQDVDEGVIPSPPSSSSGSRSPLPVQPPGAIVIAHSHDSRSSTPTQVSFHPPPSPGAIPIPSSVVGQLPAVVPVGHSSGSPQHTPPPHQTIINVGPQVIPPPGQIQPTPEPIIVHGQPQYGIPAQPGTVVVQPPAQMPPVPIAGTAYGLSRTSSRTSGRTHREPVIVIQPSHEHSSPPIVVQTTPSGHVYEDVHRPPSVHAFPQSQPPSAAPVIVNVPTGGSRPRSQSYTPEGSRRHRHRDDSRSPPRSHSPRDEGHQPRRRRHPDDDRRRSRSYSPADGGHRRHPTHLEYDDDHRRGDRRFRYSPDRGYHRHRYDDYSPEGRRRPGPRDDYFPRDEGDRPYTRRPSGRTEYSPEAEERDAGDRRRPRRGDDYSPRDEGDRPHRRRPSGRTEYSPESEERDAGDRRRPRRGDHSPRDEGDRPHRRRPSGRTEYSPEAEERDAGDRRRPRRGDDHSPQGEGDRPHRRRPSGRTEHSPEAEERDAGDRRRPRRGDDHSPEAEERGAGDRRQPRRRDDYSPRDEGDRPHRRRPSGRTEYSPEAEERDAGDRRRPRRGDDYSPEAEERDTGDRRHPRRGDDYSPRDEGGRPHRRRPSGRTEYSPEAEERDAGDRPRPPPSEARSHRRPEFIEGDSGSALPHPAPTFPSVPPASPLPPTIIRLGGDQPEHPHEAPHVIIQSRPYSPDRPMSPRSELAHDLRRVRPGDTYIPTAPSETRDRYAPRRIPSRGGPPSMIAEEDGGRPPSEMVHHVPPPTHAHAPSEPGDQDLENALRARLDDAERELTQIVHDAHNAEARHEDVFNQNENAREQIFRDNEDRRDAEARQRSDALFQQLEERAASVTPIPVPPPHDQDHVSIIESIHTAAQDAASRHASDILDTVRLEREEMARDRDLLVAERERERAHFEEERRLHDAEREAKTAALEEELARVRGELENERQLRMTEENEARMAAAERDEVLRTQLVDLTNMVQQNQALCEEKKALSEQHWAEKQRWKEERDGQMQELMGMVSRLVEEQMAARQREEEQRQANEGKPGIEQVLEELQRQNAEQRELLNTVSDNWRADSNRQHEETISAVRATANEQVPYNVQGYLDEFSKALATEVRMLLGEVGKLREERRNIQHELGYLMMMKSKYGPGGEFDPEWKPPMPPGPPPDAPPPPDVPPEDILQARPAWRTVPPRGTRRIRKPRQEAPPPEPVPEPRQVHSWVTWHPNPALAPTPPSVEPTLLVPDRGSPGLFGPRSPRDSYRG